MQPWISPAGEDEDSKMGIVLIERFFVGIHGNFGG